jgi:hypothetical protein
MLHRKLHNFMTINILKQFVRVLLQQM